MRQGPSLNALLGYLAIKLQLSSCLRAPSANAEVTDMGSQALIFMGPRESEFRKPCLHNKTSQLWSHFLSLSQ